jgi:hypothetical protein
MSHNHRAHRQHGGALAAIMLTVLILGTLTIAGLVATALYVASNVRVAEGTRRREATVETPFGDVHVRESAAFDARRMGVPVYPGAVRRRDRHKLASVHLDFGDQHKEFSVVAAEYRTYDSVDKVVEFYHHQLPHWMFSHERHGGMQLELTEGGYRKMVAIYEDEGETRIALASMGEPASN